MLLPKLTVPTLFITSTRKPVILPPSLRSPHAVFLLYKAHIGNDYLSAYLSSPTHCELLEDMEFGLIYYVWQCLLHLAWPHGREGGREGGREVGREGGRGGGREGGRGGRERRERREGEEGEEGGREGGRERREGREGR
jgi:hypothetical protein